MSSIADSNQELQTEITEDNIRTLVYRFYDKIRIDPEVGPVFHAAIQDWDKHLGIMVRFWSTVMLASRSYKGNPLAAHMGLGIKPYMFTRWLKLWKETTEELFDEKCSVRFQEKAERMGQNMVFALFGIR